MPYIIHYGRAAETWGKLSKLLETTTSSIRANWREMVCDHDTSQFKMCQWFPIALKVKSKLFNVACKAPHHLVPVLVEVGQTQWMCISV